MFLLTFLQVAMAELRFVRTMERVEVLKSKDSWSWRQPKKQRGVGRLTKSHWDYLIDEMVTFLLERILALELTLSSDGCVSMFVKNADGNLFWHSTFLLQFLSGML